MSLSIKAHWARIHEAYIPNYTSAWHPRYPQLCLPLKDAVLVSSWPLRHILPLVRHLTLQISLLDHHPSHQCFSYFQNNTMNSRTTSVIVFEPKNMRWWDLVLEATFFEDCREECEVVGRFTGEFHLFCRCFFSGLRLGFLAGLGNSGYMRDELKWESCLRYVRIISIGRCRCVCHGCDQSSSELCCGTKLDGAQNFKLRLKTRPRKKSIDSA